MDEKEIEKRMDWGLFPRDILCALQALHTFQETRDRKYEDELRSCLCDMIEELTPALDDQYKLYLDMVQTIVRGIEEQPLDLDSDADDGRVGGLQGELEGLYTRILYETHPLDNIRKCWKGVVEEPRRSEVNLRDTDAVTTHLLLKIDEELRALGAHKVDVLGGNWGGELRVDWWTSENEHDNYSLYWG